MKKIASVVSIALIVLTSSLVHAQQRPRASENGKRGGLSNGAFAAITVAVAAAAIAIAATSNSSNSQHNHSH
jgi:hypothetical protein